MKVVLERYHGLGNDYVVFDPNKNEFELTKEAVAAICNRNAGLGSDGILEGPILMEDGMHVKVWNPDGSISETSGNGKKRILRMVHNSFLFWEYFSQRKNEKILPLKKVVL